MNFVVPARPQLYVATLLLCLFVLTQAGCGGGGGGGGGSSSPPPVASTLVGTIDFSANNPAVGYTVRFGSGSPVSATTSAQGTFQIDFNTSQFSGSQPLLIYDTTGALMDRETVSVNGGTQTVGPYIVGPPTPPA